ncbi:MAG: helix-turn-helix domain-containing protein [Victivallales bacterium]|jgi:cytoskeletal protein RodZ|nr:helix-turn-helix domain-containing protein [Victivallales bacterium]
MENLKRDQLELGQDELPMAVDSEVREVPTTSGRSMASRPLGDAGSLGSCLSDLRQRSHYTIEQLALETKIKESYLEALEAEDYKNLPQTVYVMGYIRKLCALYGVSKTDADTLTSGLREQLQYELPEDITKSVVDHEISEENERKLRQLIMVIAGVIALLVIALIVAGVMILAGVRKSETVAAPFNENSLIELQGVPQIEMRELK